jgi:drug/metabolite transporter (DMT)-like permease
VCFGIGLPLQTRRARVLPDLGVAPARAALAFLRDVRWMAASGVVLAGWGLELTALARAPVALVFPTAAAGVAVVGLLSARWFGERLSRGEWAGVVVTLIGVALGAASAGEAPPGPDRTNVLALAAAASALLVLSAAALLLGRGGRARELIPSGASGLLYAGSGLLTKALGVALDESAGLAAEAGLLALIVLFAAGGAFALQVAVQRGRATVAAAWSTAISSLLPGLLAGPVFGEAWPAGAQGSARAGSVVALAVGFLLLLGGPRREGATSLRIPGGTAAPAGPEAGDVRTSR